LGEIRYADRISVRQLKRKDDLLVDQMIILKRIVGKLFRCGLAGM